jgi:hypothetical protein
MIDSKPGCGFCTGWERGFQDMGRRSNQGFIAIMRDGTKII